ncbi:MAG: glycosyltransferase [Candidatus Rokubacteria bacterium]|nr:glycosyltransferase [Candidatus Rokubacteria bacterium]
MQPRSIAVPPPTGAAPLSPWNGRLAARGKFFFSGVEKVLLKGITYGPFAPDGSGIQFPDRDTVKGDLALIAELGANTLRTFTVPPRWLLDLADQRDLRVLVGIPWAEHICFLDSTEVIRSIRRTITEAVEGCRGHPAVAAYLVGNEIPPDIVRWNGARRVAAFLRELVDVVKGLEPDTLVGYANFPSTEYLETEFTDFLAFNVYLHREADLRRYLHRLHTLAGDRPLVLTEFGMDSVREGEQAQAATLSWQVRTALEMGVAGTCVFSFTDEWFTGGHAVTDWGFGLVDRGRRRKPAFHAVQRRYTTDGLPALSEYPKVSVVVCAYNAESTIAACLDSLRELRYPAYEVVVVDDGSTDRTGQIADEYEGVHVIHQENRGLSAARNVGIAASVGDIVAFTDSDCVADPDWLHYLVAAFLSSGWPAVGGPNLPPPEDSLVASCVAAAPGGPLHVLLTHEEAEHIPGCNMAFRREMLEEIGGFDPIFRAAGDDVDLCWRLQERGHRIAFSPAAMVWHFRRNTVQAYIGQQRGYGKAEGLLYFRHQQRFNALGYSRWRGRIYGGIYSLFTSLLSLRRPVIYGGVFGRGLFQTLYQPPSGLLAHLPLTLEWNAAAAALLAVALVRGGWAWLGAAPLLLTWGCCLGAALRARVDVRADSLRGRLLIALLTSVGPLVRCFERYRWLARGLSAAEPDEGGRPVRALPVSWREGALSVAFWTEDGLEKEAVLEGLREAVAARKYFVLVDQGWSEWDLEVYGGLWSRGRVTVATEYHGAGRRVLRVKCAVRGSLLGRLVGGGALLLGALGVALGSGILVTAGLGGAAVGAAAFGREALKLGRTLHRSLQAVARQTRLHYAPPLQAPAAAAT